MEWNNQNINNDDYISISELTKESLKDRKIIIEGIIEGNTVSSLSADPKMGKSTLALQIANCVSQGIPFLNHRTVKQKVLYFCLDNSREAVNNRCRKMGINSSDIIMCFLQFKIDDLRGLIHAAQLNYENIGLVIIDMFNNIREFDYITENSNAEIQKNILNLIDIARDCGVAILLLHHNRKQKDSNVNNQMLGGIMLSGTIDGTMLAITRKNLQSVETTLDISGREVESKQIDLIFDKKNISFEFAPEPITELSKDIVRIISHIVKSKQFEGTVQELTARLNLQSNPRLIGKELSENALELEKNGIVFSKRKSNGKRIITLQVHEDYITDSDKGSKGHDISVGKNHMSL